MKKLAVIFILTLSLTSCEQQLLEAAQSQEVINDLCKDDAQAAIDYLSNYCNMNIEQDINVYCNDKDEYDSLMRKYINGCRR